MPPTPIPTPLPSSFTSKKSHILSSLAVDPSEYDDLSPKGSIDTAIRDLIDEINACEGLVTTSSCAGRISVFLEGKRKGAAGNEDEDEVQGDGLEEGVKDELDNGEAEGGERATTAGVGGKGGGGRWLFVSHDPVSEEESDWAEKLGMKRAVEADLAGGMKKDARLIHFKFEPMILHVLTASLSQAQLVLSAAMQAGFRESGALNLISSSSSSSSSSDPATPMVGIRTMGLALESIIGYEVNGEERCMVPEWQLRRLIEVSNDRFVENTKRIERFRGLLMKELGKGEEAKMGDVGVWEGKEERRERKRREGLEKAKKKGKKSDDAEVAL